jgi:RNA-binding protein
VKELTPAQRRDLRARAHHLQPVVMIGDAGLTPEVIREIEANLKSH